MDITDHMLLIRESGLLMWGKGRGFKKAKNIVEIHYDPNFVRFSFGCCENSIALAFELLLILSSI